MNGNNQSGDKVVLPVMEILVNAFRYVYEERRDFIALASLPVVGLALIASGLDHVMPGSGIQVNEQGLPVSVGPRFFLNFAVTVIFFAMFAVAWYRKFLVGESDVTVWAALKWDQRKLRFVTRFCGLILLIALVMAPVIIGFNLILAAGLAVGPIFFFVLMVVAVLAYARGSLWLTAGCVDDPIRLRQVWSGTQGNSWRLAVLTLTPPLLLSIVQMTVVNVIALILNAVGMLNGLTGGLLITLVAESLAYIGIAVVASALAMAYLRFKASWV